MMIKSAKPVLNSNILKKIIDTIYQFEHSLKQQKNTKGDLNSDGSWKSLNKDNDSVYSNTTPIVFSIDILENFREYTQHFTGNTPPSNFKNQTSAIKLHQILSEDIPEDYIYFAPPIYGEQGWPTLHPKYGSMVVNDDVNSYQERLNHLYKSGCIERLNKQSKIIEIGGGFGALAKSIHLIAPSCLYVIVDLPSSLKFAYAWLTLNKIRCKFVNTKNDLVAHENFDIYLINCDDKNILDDMDFDLAINTLSFTEMNRNIVNNYGEFLQLRLLKKSGVLFEQNNEYPNHLGTNKITSTTDVFYHHFKIMQLTSRCSMLGKVRLWSDSQKNIPRISAPSANEFFKPYTVALFGASKTGMMLKQEFFSKRDVSYFYDNDPTKWNTSIANIPVCSPEKISQHIQLAETANKPLLIVIASYFTHEIFQQLVRFEKHLVFINELESFQGH